MTVFSRRNGYNTDGIQLECASDVLKRRIYARFYKQEFDFYDTFDLANYTTGIEDMMIEMGVPYEFPQNQIIKKKNAEDLRRYIMLTDEWYVIYDFIERYLKLCNPGKANEMRNAFNAILEDEMSAYRIIDNNRIVPITNESELATIQEARHTDFDSVNVHITKALERYADRRSPDYENSIKESISAVEAMCCIITGNKNATLGEAIKTLKDKGVHIHQAMAEGFSKLYGYTSNEPGIRHGSIDFTNAPAEDAKYMLISCSAFVNYLIEKWSKIKQDSK